MLELITGSFRYRWVNINNFYFGFYQLKTIISQKVCHICQITSLGGVMNKKYLLILREWPRLPFIRTVQLLVYLFR